MSPYVLIYQFSLTLLPCMQLGNYTVHRLKIKSIILVYQYQSRVEPAPMRGDITVFN